MKKYFLNAVVAVTLTLAVFSARSGLAADREGEFQAGLGTGVAFNSPVRFDLQIGGEYFIRHNISLGLNIDFLINDGAAFAFIPFGRYLFDISGAERWVPYVGGGIGGIVSDSGDGALDIMIPNFGFFYEVIEDRFLLGSDMSVHILTDFDNSDWDFRWLIVTAKYRF